MPSAYFVLCLATFCLCVFPHVQLHAGVSLHWSHRAHSNAKCLYTVLGYSMNVLLNTVMKYTILLRCYLGLRKTDFSVFN